MKPLARVYLAWGRIILAGCLCVQTLSLAQDTDGDGLLDSEEWSLGTSTRNPDTDGDGLLDGWEVHGFSYAGWDEPLAAYGADPLVKDIFVEIDWMASSGDDTQLNARIAYEAAVDVTHVFRRSGTGIRIHFDLGPRIESIVPPEALDPDVDFSAFSVMPDERKTLAYQEKFFPRPDGGAASTLRSLYDVYYDGYHFRPSRRNIFYYFVFAEQARPETDPADPSAGNRNQPRVDDFADEAARRDGLQSTGVHAGVIYRRPLANLSPEFNRYRYSVHLLHELGHCFGFGHGGALPGYRWSNENNKPNYLSIMNYRYQYCGVAFSGNMPVMDFSHGLLTVPLKEGQLMEPVGMGGLPDDPILLCTGLAHIPSPEHPRNIDWNRDGRITSATVVQDLNENGRIDSHSLSDHDDWGKLLRDGFDGIGSNAFRRDGFKSRDLDVLTILPGDFNGDGLTDFFVLRGTRASWILATPEGQLTALEESRRDGHIGIWSIGPVAHLLVGDYFSSGRDMILAHREREVAVIELNENSPRLRWYEDNQIPAEDQEEESGGWTLQPIDQFLQATLSPQDGHRIVVTNGDELSILAPTDMEPTGLQAVWKSDGGLVPWTGQELSLWSGRSLPTGGEGVIAGGSRGLFELLGPEANPSIVRIDVEGVIPGASTGADDTAAGWALSCADEIHHVDLDGDGSTELVLKSPTRIGVVDWVNEVPRLVWSASDHLGGIWNVSASDRVHYGEFLPREGSQVLLSSGQGWIILQWDESTGGLGVLGLDNGYLVGDTRWKLSIEQALLVGRFIAGEPEMVLVHGTDGLLLARLETDHFEPFQRFDGELGEWRFDRNDRLLPLNLDQDPELEILARNDLTFGVLDFSPPARTTFVSRLDAETMQFVDDPEFLRGDTNADGEVDISDAVASLGSLFLGFRSPPCADAADADDSGTLNVSDPIYVLAFLFNQGTPPPPPGPHFPGLDPTPDGLGCDS